MNRVVSEDKRNLWLEHLQQCNLGTGVGKLWSTLKSLSISGKRDDRTSITFDEVTVTDPKRCARLFNRQFIVHTESNWARRRASLRADGQTSQFTLGNVMNVIRGAKSSKALGLDEFSTLMLDLPGVEYLTTDHNLYLNALIVSDVWIMGRVLSLLKLKRIRV